MSVCKKALCAAGLFIAMTADALAYGGPGAAITLIGSLVGVGLAIFASLFYVIVWPLRRMLKKRKTDADAEAPQEIANEVADSDSVSTATNPAQGG